MTVGAVCAHDWVRDASSKGPTNVTLTCRNCGATSVSRGKMKGRTVSTSLDLYPQRGASMLDPQLYEFFIRQWDAEINALTQSGYLVHRRSPVVHTQARGVGGGRRARRSDSQFLTGRDLVIGTAIVLLGGSAMLVAGLQLQISWLATAGGVSLGILVLLVLLVIFLSS
jgi:hypothetical protein